MKREAIGVCDVGASGCRISTLSRDAKGYDLQTVYEFVHPVHDFQLTDSAGHAARRLYWNPSMIYGGIEEGLRRISADKEKRLLSFGADGWGGDGLWLSRFGDPLTPVVLAYDERWRQAREEVNRVLPGKRRFDLTGTYPDDFLVVNQLYWFAKNMPDLIDIADTYMPLPSLYHYWLCGEKAMEYTWSTTGQLASCITKTYCDEVFSTLGLPRDKMPALRQTGGVLGMSHAALAKRLGLEPFKVMAAPNHDTACAYAAAPVKPGRTALIISAGTWWCMGTNLEKPLINDDVFASHFSNVGGAEGVVFNVINMGSHPAQALRRQWEREDATPMPWEAFSRLAAEGNTNGYEFNIDDERMRTPADMAACVAEVAGLPSGGSRPSRSVLAALVYRGLAQKAARLAKTLGRLLGRPVDEILMIGGGSRNDLLNQWVADESGLPVRTGSPSSTTLGSALVQAVSLGWFSSLAEGREALRGLWDEKEFHPKAK